MEDANLRIHTRRLGSATSALVLALAASATSAGAQPMAVRDAEPVVLTGKQVPAWTRSAAQVVCTPVAASPGRDAHKGTVTVPPDARTGVDASQIVAFKWDSAQWVEIPVQVDQMYYYCLGNPNSQTFGQFYSQTDKELTYAFDVAAGKEIDCRCSVAYPTN